MIRLNALCVGLLSVIFSAVSLGATIDVPSTKPSIQAAVDAAAPGDTIRVAPVQMVHNGIGFGPQFSSRCP